MCLSMSIAGLAFLIFLLPIQAIQAASFAVASWPRWLDEGSTLTHPGSSCMPMDPFRCLSSPFVAGPQSTSTQASKPVELPGAVSIMSLVPFSCF
jgi:hypothetical protein